MGRQHRCVTRWMSVSRQEAANGVPPYMEVRMHCKENVSLRGIRKDRQNARIEEAKARLARDVQEFHGRVMAD